MRKEGVNKGKKFYVCSKQPQCAQNFFKWADEVANNSVAGPSTSGGNRNFHQNDNNDNNNAGGGGKNSIDNQKQNMIYFISVYYTNINLDFVIIILARAKRKCGICKEEGHTRLKCPRNN